MQRSMQYGLADVTRDLLGLDLRSTALRKDEFWGLRDIDFQVEPGECLGVIGPNGAGKSTLLKLLSGIFLPDQGHLLVRGKVGTLIEVGAGFHPLLTGRENIYVNGTILGMSKRDISRKLDQIIAFSGVEEFIDAPVKHYSSGMFVRLGFSVAVHSTPRVLLVDEALAVGDVEFSIRCLNRIADLRRNGVAVVFVSHNELQVREAASRCLLLSHGIAAYLGDVEHAFQRYESLRAKDQNIPRTGPLVFGSSVSIPGLKITEADGEDQPRCGNDVDVELTLRCARAEPDAYLELRFWDSSGHMVGSIDSRTLGTKLSLPRGGSRLRLLIHAFPLNQGWYRVAGGIRRDGEVLGWSRDLISIAVQAPTGFAAAPGTVALRVSQLDVTEWEG